MRTLASWALPQPGAAAGEAGRAAWIAAHGRLRCPVVAFVCAGGLLPAFLTAALLGAGGVARGAVAVGAVSIGAAVVADRRTCGLILEPLVEAFAVHAVSLDGHALDHVAELVARRLCAGEVDVQRLGAVVAQEVGSLAATVDAWDCTDGHHCLCRHRSGTPLLGPVGAAVEQPEATLPAAA